MTAPTAAIIGLSGPVLQAAESELFRRHRPLGVILFARNIRGPEQLQLLTACLREELGDDTPILVDQEGGRVARLKPPYWPAWPAAAAFEGLPAEAARANAAMLGLDCAAMGMNVVCAPVLDLRVPGAHDIIGDRAFSADPAEVARLGAAWVQGLQQAGCVPVIKHIPGHGRAQADSHLELPRVAAGREALAADWQPFQALAASGAWAMTAHILFEALDPTLPVTLSPRVIGGLIRGALGFDGVLVSDDLGMQALQGDLGALAARSIEAGCDIALHCSGVLAESEAVLAACPPLSDAAAARLAAARHRARGGPLDANALRDLRDAALAGSA